MGTYATLQTETREGQVKCWDDEGLPFFKIGDKVPNIGDDYSYVIAMREGGYVVVFKNTFIAWEDTIPDESINWPLYDKWGGLIDSDESFEKATHGLSGNEPYLL